MDREVIVERAEALRGWLAGHGLSTRAAGALERELQGILTNDPGSYINGQRPLAGVTVDEFVSALHSRNAGVVGKVKNVGDAVIAELRAAIPADAAVAAPAAAEAPDFVLPELPALEEDEAPVATDVAPASFSEAAPAPEAEAAPRKRGRPKGSKNRPRVVDATAAPQQAEPAAVAAPDATLGASDPAAPEAPKPRRGRPRRVDTPAPASNGVSSPNGTKAAARRAAAPVAAPAASAPAQPPSIARADQALDQLVRIWPSLHPHARRAIVLYASTLLAEAGFSG